MPHPKMHPGDLAADLSLQGLRGITRLAFDAAGTRLALIAER